MTSISHAAAVLAMAAVLGAAAPASSRSLVAADAFLAATSPAAVSSSPSACADGKYNLIDPTDKPHWHSTLRWRYKSSTTPSYLTTAAVVKVLKRAFNNITLARNDCGRADHVSATSEYLGTTSRAIGVTKEGSCGSQDGFNTIGFGAIPAGYLALTCVSNPGSTIDEADIRLATGFHWALSTIGCLNDYMLESVVTHELGHAYGLDHVGELSHGRLTMSRYIDGTCENQEAKLGLGDMKGLEALY